MCTSTSPWQENVEISSLLHLKISCKFRGNLLHEDVGRPIDSVGVDVALLVDGDVVLVVEVAEIHGARVRRELGLIGVGGGHPDVAAVGRHVEGGAGESPVANHIATLGLD